MKKYSDTSAVTWDAWFVNRGNTTHAFYLQNGPLTPQDDPRVGWAVGHAVTENGLDWTALPSVLPPRFDPNDPSDFHSKFTGCAVNHNDVCYLFYTMRDQEKGSQRIGVAVSHDWEHFELWPGNPVVVNDSQPIPVSAGGVGTLVGYETIARYDWNIVDCRDFIVVKQGEGYVGYWAAAADLGGECPVGVIVMARSRDLLHWDDQRIVYSVDHHGVLEVPDVFEMDGKWVLVCLSGMNYSGRAVTNDRYASNATIVAYADTCEGPFEEPTEDNILIAGPVQSGFTCRSVPRNGRRYLYYIDRAAGKNAFSLPKELHMVGGNLRATYCRALDERLGEPLPLCFNKEPNSFAWRTFGGTHTLENGMLTLMTAPKDYHAISMPMPQDIAAEGSVMVKARLQVSGEGGGLFLRTANCPYLLLLESALERVALWRLYSFENVATRRYPLCESGTYEIRCILIDGVIEVYIDDVLVLQCGLPTQPLTHIGFAADRGSLIADNIVIQGMK
jgi:beta-fructofuranosidase